MHGLGPHDVTVNGRQITVREELKETYSALEEAKADISGLFAIQYMIDKGVLPKSLERPLYTTYLASSFRSIRFGTSEAHGLGMAVQFNYLLDHGGFGRQAERDLCRHAGQNQSGGRRPDAGNHDHSGGRQLREGERSEAQLGVIRPEVQRALDKLKGVPVDIEPKFTTAEQLVRENP